MIRRWQSVPAVESVDVLLATMSLRAENSGLRLNVEIRRAVEVPVKIRSAAEATEEPHPRARLESKADTFQKFNSIACRWISENACSRGGLSMG